MTTEYLVTIKKVVYDVYSINADTYTEAEHIARKGYGLFKSRDLVRRDVVSICIDKENLREKDHIPLDITGKPINLSDPNYNAKRIRFPI